MYFSEAEAINAIAPVSTTISPTGHKWNNGVVTTAPTCTEYGVKTYTCTICGDNSLWEYIEPSHTLSEVPAKSATCTEQGNTAYWHCTVCDKYFGDAGATVAIALSDTVVAILPHSYVRSVCELCGRSIVENGDLGLLDRYNGDYGYEYLGTLEHGAAMQIMYVRMEDAAKQFHVDSSRDAVLSGQNDYYIAFETTFNDLGLSMDEAVSVWRTFKNENPLYYWMSNSILASSVKLSMIADEEFIDGDVRVEYNDYIYDRIEYYLAQNENGDSAYLSALLYHDLIIEAIDYSLDENDQPQSAPWAHSIVGVLSGRGGVCDSYAKTYQILLNCTGVENLFVDGMTANGAHAWNIVRMDDGKWYWVDVTWDDPVGYGSLTVVHTYFCLNDVKEADGYTFTDTHVPYGGNLGINFLYALPERSDEETYSGENAVLDAEFTVGDFTYKVISIGRVELTASSLTSGSVVVPASVVYNGREYCVYSIGPRAFSYSDIDSVIIPSGVVEIGNYVFVNCQSLENITIPASVRRIGFQTFGYCYSLSTVYYGGTADQWNAISIGNYNESLLSANVVCAQ